ncbi:MAG: hypothetical protein ACOH1O_02750 [Flavobacterium sp.]
MKETKKSHTFHIPVMGLAYTIDSPIRVAHLGIASAVSITDDDLIEKMRSFYSKKFSIPYQEITQKIHDYRAERITHYLDMMDTIVKIKLEDFKTQLVESKEQLENYIAMLPSQSDLSEGLQSFVDGGVAIKETLKKYLDENLFAGSIDVNIMTKVDKENFIDGQKLDVIFNDAHASLRGFANSKLTSAVVLSAGMNPRLYGYFEQFNDFYPDANGNLGKKIILKVSDYRSAMIQGNFLAKKGLWVSEYRIESGLNCGGHAFATDGHLMGPILEEFKSKRSELISSAHSLMVKALELKNLPIPNEPLELHITAQGGVGTSEEHDFLISEYDVASVGWGSPLLLCPEATSVDVETRGILAKAKEKDFYLSDISPLGVPFNTVKGMSNQYFKQSRIDQNKAGSSCPKKLLALSKEYGDEGICTASKKYQDLKIAVLEEEKGTLSKQEFDYKKMKITEKACLCVGLANASYLENDIKIKGQQQGVVICPGPNLAYFDKEVSLSTMTQHIYGKTNIINESTSRPNMFVNEIKMYVDYIKEELLHLSENAPATQIKKLTNFKANLLSGINYYNELFDQSAFFSSTKDKIKEQLKLYSIEINSLEVEKAVLA